MTTASHQKIIIAVDTQFDWALDSGGRHRCKHRKERRLRLLPTEPATHAAHLNQNLIRGDTKRVRNRCLHLAGMLG